MRCVTVFEKMQIIVTLTKEFFMFEKKEMLTEPLLVDVKTTARLLNVCEKTVRNLTKLGELPVVKIASRVLYSRDDLIEFIRRRSKRE